MYFALGYSCNLAVIAHKKKFELVKTQWSSYAKSRGQTLRNKP